MLVLLLNAGSSSLKASVMDSATESTLVDGLADWAGAQTRYSVESQASSPRSETVEWKGHAKAVERFIVDLPASLRDNLAAVGHRIVHGGAFSASLRITPEVRSRIESLIDLAPLHNPPSLDTLLAAQALLPAVPHIAVFDTAFHATLPPEAYTYPIPMAWTRDWGIRRYGFHGLSHAYCARRAAEMLKQDPQSLRLVICHLGHGCSASAVKAGQCVETTMGFSPLEGLMMGTRCGSIDPSIVLHVQEKHGLTAMQVDTALNRLSGLLGVSGLSADMRQVLAAAHAGNDQAALALKVYTHRVRMAIGALTATLGGIDALIFTAGVGEHSAEIRQSICAGLECLGLELDSSANATARPDVDIATASSKARILAIATREDITMLRDVQAVLTLH